MTVQVPVAYRDCKNKPAQVEQCQIRVMHFKVWNRKCPREIAEAGFEPATAKPETPITTATPIAPVKSTEPLTTNIRIADLEPGVFSPRMQFDPKYIGKLAEDIEAEGQLKPIMVRPHPTQPEKYQVIDGEHRVRALQKLGKTVVRAEVHILTDEEAYYRAMRINQLHGKRLEELEEACHVNKMISVFGYTEEQVGKRFGRSQSWVRDRISLACSLAPTVEEHVSSRLLTSTHAIEIADLPKEEQTKVAATVAQKKLSVKATRGLVHALKKASPEKKQQILEKPLEVYATEFKDPKQMEKALLTIEPHDDFAKKSEEIKTEEQAEKFWDKSKPEDTVQTLECPGCGKQLRVDWGKGEVTWD